MGLWIRSQDKYKNIFSNGQIIRPMSGKYHIFDITDKEMFYTLGCYTTEEQALKVLNEINNLVKPKMIISYNSMLSKKDRQRIENERDCIITDKMCNIERIPNVCLYQMPQDLDNKDEVLK